MPNPSSISNFRKRDPFIAVLIFAVVVVILEASLAFLPQNKLVKTFHADSLPPKSPDWQIMGDSVAEGGIVATQVAAFLPEKEFVYNGALAGTGPEFSYFILKRQIAAGKTPKAIIYAPSPHTFASQRIALLVGGYCHWDEIFVVAKTGLEPCDVVYGILCKLSYSLRYREQIGDLFKGRGAIDPDNPDTAQHSTRTMNSPVKHYTVDTIHPMYKKPFSVQKFNRVFLEKFLRLANENNIPVYWVTMPVLPAVYESRKRFNFDDEYYDFLRDLQQRHGIRFLQKEFIVWDDAHFKDMTHLTPAAAQEFSKLIGKKLSELGHTDAKQRNAAINP